MAVFRGQVEFLKIRNNEVKSTFWGTWNMFFSINSEIGLKILVFPGHFETGTWRRIHNSRKKQVFFHKNENWVHTFEFCCMPETRWIEHFSNFLSFNLSSKNSHQLGLNQPTVMFDHSKESSEPGEEDRTWAGALRTLQVPKKWRKTGGAHVYRTTV